MFELNVSLIAIIYCQQLCGCIIAFLFCSHLYFATHSYTLQAGHVEFSYERLMVMFEMLLIHCRRVMWSSAMRDLW